MGLEEDARCPAFNIFPIIFIWKKIWLKLNTNRKINWAREISSKKLCLFH